MRRRILGGLVACLALLSCGKDPVFGDLASAVRLVETGNVLRYEVEVDLRGDVAFPVLYLRPAGGEWQAHSSCIKTGGKLVFPIMFLYPSTDYEFYVNLVDDPGFSVFKTPKSVASDPQTFRTRSLPPEVPVYQVTVDKGGPESGYLLQWQATSPGWITFCDMQGRVVWYEPFDQAVRHVHFDGSELAVLTGFREGVNSPKFQRLCDRIIVLDLMGHRSIDWLASEENVPYPHHDIRLMADGNLLIFNAVVKNFDLTSLEGGADVPLWGDGFTILDRTGAKVRSWDVFSVLDPLRDTWLDPLNLDFDLLHGNSVNTDSEGDFYLTFNRYSELWKVDGLHGGTLWRLGEHGDVTLDGKLPVGGLHSAVPLDPDRVLVYNNGAGASRAQIYRVNSSSKTASLELDVELSPEYSSADRSNVELLTGADGVPRYLMFASTLARACVFTDMKGNVVKVVQRTGIAYRSHYFWDVFY